MNLDPIRTALTDTADLFAWLSKSTSETATSWLDMRTDGSTDLILPALAGIATALTVALVVALYVQNEYPAFRSTVRRSLVTALALSLLAFAAYDMRNVALAYLEKASVKPATEFELRWQKTTERARTLAAEMGGQTRSLSAAASDARRG